jgi:hypothetical protein
MPLRLFVQILIVPLFNLVGQISNLTRLRHTALGQSTLGIKTTIGPLSPVTLAELPILNRQNVLVAEKKS